MANYCLRSTVFRLFSR